MLPIDILLLIAEKLDFKSLLIFSTTSEELLTFSSPIIKRYLPNVPEITVITNTIELDSSPFASLLVGLMGPLKKKKKISENIVIFHQCVSKLENLQIKIKLFKLLDLKISRFFNMLVLYDAKTVLMMHQEGLLNYSQLVKSLYENEEKLKKEEVTELVKLLPKSVLLKLWNDCFKSLDCSTILKDNLEVLTMSVLDNFREVIFIDKKFLSHCFRHDLQYIILYLFDNHRFFTCDFLSSQDYFLYFCCDYSSIELLSKLDLVKLFEPKHLNYSISYSTNEFLMTLWQMRAKLPFDFNACISDLSRVNKTPGSKQKFYFDWCKSHQ